jgi:gliding motility-associated-like protein
LALKFLHLHKRILHIGLSLGLILTSTVLSGQTVTIENPSNVCKGKPFALIIHSDQPISFQLQRRSINTANNWQAIDKFSTVSSGSDNVFTYNPTITFTTEYRIWYTTDLNFDPDFPNLASPAPVYLSQIAQIDLFSTPIVTSFTSNQFCSGLLFQIIPVAGDGAGNTVPSTYTWSSPNLTLPLSGGASTNVASGSISGTLTSIASSIQSATYTVTPTSILGGCPGNPFTVTIPIKPTPSINSKAPEICSGDAFNVNPVDGTDGIVPSGTTYTWLTPTVTGTSGSVLGGTSGSGNSIGGTLTNTTTSVQFVTYIVTAYAGTCTSSTFTVTVKVKPRPSVANNPTIPQICNGFAFSFTPPSAVPSGTQYFWSVTELANVSGESSVITPTANFSQTLSTSSVSGSVSISYVVTPITDGCAGPSFNASVELIPSPVINSPLSTQLCSGGNLNFTPANGTHGIVPAGTMYNWSIASNSEVTGQNEELTTPRSGIIDAGISIVNPTNTEKILLYTVTTITSGCASSTFQLSVTIVPSAQINNKNIEIITGQNTSITPGPTYSDVVLTNTNYTWTIQPNSNIDGFSATVSPTTSINQVLTNLTNTPQTAIYNVSSVANTCASASFSMTVNVLPKPIISAKNNTVDSHTPFSVSITDNSPTQIVPASTIYTWTVPSATASLTGVVSGTDVGTISGTYINLTNVAQTATYTVTPTYVSPAPTLRRIDGTLFPVSVIVNPRPKIASKVATICSGGTFSVTITDNSPSEIVPSNTVYTWSIPSMPNGLTGGVSATNAGTISGTLVNQTSGTLTATYTVTPWSGTAAGDPFTVSVTVNPKATIQNNIATPVCTGTAFAFTPNSNDIIPIGTTFSWSNPVVTGSMTGGISATNAGTISGTLTNPTNAEQTALYSITTSSGNCAGATFTMSVTVNPRPQILPKATMINSGGTFSVTITNNVNEVVPVNTNYSWGLPTITSSLEGAVIVSGAGSISGTLTNISSAVQTATYSVTPNFNGCAGAPFALTVTVNPKPKILSNIHNVTICSGGTFSVTITDNSPTEIVPSNTTYTWSGPSMQPGIIGGVAATNSGTISGTLVNQTPGMLTATYTITPKSGTAEGDPFTVVVTVNPKATIASNSATPVCSGFPFTFTPPNTDIVPLGTTYSWSIPSVTGGMTGGANATNVATISGTLTNPTNSQKTATYSITPLSGACTGGTFTLTVNINALPYSPTTTANTVVYNKQPHGFIVSLNPANASDEILRWYSTPGDFSTISPTYTLANTYTISVSSYNQLTQCESAQKVTASLIISKKFINAQASAIDKVYDQTKTATATVTSNELENGDIVNFAHGGAEFDNKNVGTGKSVALTNVTISPGGASSNYTLTPTSSTLSTTASITVKPITVLATADNRVYNATASATVTLSSPGVINPDDVLFNYAQALFNNKTANVGKQVNVTGIRISGGADAGNYTLTATTATTTGTISKSEITIIGAVASDRVYNGTISATITGGTISASILLADVVTLDLKGEFNNRNVGVSKPVTSISTIGGADAANYNLTQPAGLTASITKKVISEISPVTQNKVYDATTKVVNYTSALKTKQAPGAGTVLDSIPYTIDDVSIVSTAEFDNKNVGNTKSINSTSIIDGVDKGNYELVKAINLTPRNITKKTLNMSGLSVPASKVYDGTTSTVLTDNKSLLTASLPGQGTVTDGKPYTTDISNLSITGTAIGNYNSKNVLTANTVTFTGLVLTGTESGNYSLTIQAPQPATITKKELTMSGLSVPSTKIYDATTKANVIDNKILQSKITAGTGNKDDGKPYDPDDVSLSGTPVANYNTKDVTTAIVVNFSGLSLTGADAGNYILKIQNQYNATIVPLVRNVVANQQYKIYGQVDPIFTYTADPLLESDLYSGELKRVDGKNVGSYPIEIGTLTGGSNYQLNLTPNVLIIDKAIMFITAKDAFRTYGDLPLQTQTNSTEFIADGLKYDEKVGYVTISYPNGPGSGNAINDSVGKYEGVVNAVDVSGGTFNIMNYKTIFFRGDLIVKILPIIVSAESKEKREGQQDPALTFKTSIPLVVGDEFTGLITREPGEIAGAYQIQIGTLALNNNYQLTFRPAVFLIKPEEPTFVLPKAFTPNGDGVNDVLKIIQDGISSINYYQIFNRSGRLVFQTKDLSVGWDGRFNGVVLDSDAYYWNVEFVTWNKKVIKISGTVILIK